MLLFTIAAIGVSETVYLVGAVTSLHLVYIQWQVIKIWCFWCLVSAITVFLMAIIILANL